MEGAALGLPLLNDSGISVLLILDAACVLEFSELSGPLLEHLLLDDASLLAVTLIDLLQDISLVILLG